ncbi:GntR family transcriptional regulator [Natribacillus halophilus]|uniref:Transcriptional regulator, GntR family n=1 Tax=Natribacillus halophilus TaxID=549003 RepID=A0A1G8N7U0_9BACI|nr:GntR family transcriptional regulator [Natribacillus halophilus]SDI75640.1 transcriptional regulator, GntR family [Natribacillus halophilus]
MKLDHNNPLPLHAQLKQKMADRINDGYYSNQLPSERSFMDEFEISRNTVREAISSLVTEGLLIKRHGVGTFVSPKPIQDWLGTLKSTTETIREMELQQDIDLITHGTVKPSNQLKRKIDDDSVYFIKRLRFADGHPIALENEYYPLNIGNQLTQYDLNTETIIDLLENELGFRLNRANQVIKAGKISNEDSKLLQFHQEESVLISERLITSEEGQWLEFSHTYYRPDLYSFSIDLERKNG